MIKVIPSTTIDWAIILIDEKIVPHSLVLEKIDKIGAYPAAGIIIAKMVQPKES